MRCITWAILFSFLLQVAFIQRVQTVCIGTDHVTLNCHEQEETPCSDSPSDDGCGMPLEEDPACVDVVVGADESPATRSAPVVPAVAWADALPVNFASQFVPIEVRCVCGAAEGWVCSFCAPTHARTIVIRC